MMRKRDDQLWKGILENVFDDFVCFMHPNADEIFDFSRGVEFLDKELEQLFPPEGDQYSPKIVDKLAKLYTWEGKEEWILIHLEVQGKYEKDFGSRMFRYYYRILDKYEKPITACAILTEGNLIRRPDTFKQECLGTRLSYKYNTFKIAEQDEQELLESSNPFSIVVLTVKLALERNNVEEGEDWERQLLALKLELARTMLAKNVSKKKTRQLMNFLRYYVRFESSDINSKFEKEIAILTERSETMGLEELLLDRAKKQGEKAGVKIGVKAGVKIGEKAGLEKGKREEAIAIATEFKKMGIALTDISKGTRLPIKTIEKL